MKIAMQRAIVVISEFVRMQNLRASGEQEKGGLGKLKGAIGVVSTLSKVGGKGATSHLQREDSHNANDPSVILTMITGGKMKEVDEEGLVVEEEEDEPPHVTRRMSSRSDEEQDSSSPKAEELLLEMKLHAKEMKQAMADSRKEMKEALAEMRKEIVDLKSQVTFSSA